MVYKGRTELSALSFKLPDSATVFQAEVSAVAKAAEFLLGLDDPGMKYVKIFVDSQAAIKAVGNPVVKSQVVEQAINNLNKLAAKTRSVTLVWIPAHKGHTGNERADVLAKAGSEGGDQVEQVRVNKPQGALRSEIRRCMASEWENEWGSLQTAHHSRTFYAQPSAEKAKFVYKLARLELGRFVRVITGHNNLNFFQHKLGLTGDTQCRLCGEGDETVTHFLNACPRLVAGRREIFLDKLPTADMTWSVRDLLDFSYLPGINEAYEGTWAAGDPLPGGDDMSDTSFGLDRLEEDELD